MMPYWAKLRALISWVFRTRADSFLLMEGRGERSRGVGEWGRDHVVEPPVRREIESDTWTRFTKLDTETSSLHTATISNTHTTWAAG